jgi:hypothetical protein
MNFLRVTNDSETMMLKMEIKIKKKKRQQQWLESISKMKEEICSFDL